MIAVARTQIETHQELSATEAQILGDPTGAAEVQKASAPLGYVRAPAGCLPGTYALSMDEAGGGLLAPPGSTVVVEPAAPTGAGLAVLYFDGRPEVWDLTHEFIPGSFDRTPGRVTVEFVKVIQPHTGRIGFAKVDAVEKAHRIVGVYRPDDVVLANRPAPSPLPLFAVCPEGMGQYRVDTAAAYPAVRPGETVIFDPSQRDLVTEQLCVIELGNGRRSVLLTDYRKPGPNDQKAWWVDPVNRPSSAAVMERLLKSKRMGALFASDGPYDANHLRSKIVGRVIGILVQQERPRDEVAQASTAQLALPAPGSPEARAAWHAACREHSIRTAPLNDCPELTRADQETWTVQSLTRAMETGEITVAEFTRLQPIASLRELRFAEITHELRIGELFALAYADEYPVASDEAATVNPAPDPIFAAIERHATARATLEATCSSQDGASDTAAHQAASGDERAAWKALFEERPSTLPGVLLLLWHAERWAAANDGLAGGPSVTEAIGHIADSLAAVVGTATGEVHRAIASDAERRAFVVAAADMLDHELVTEIWSRARELRPAAFDQGGARHAG